MYAGRFTTDDVAAPPPQRSQHAVVGEGSGSVKASTILRLSSDITYGANNSDVDALIEENLDKSTYRRREDASPFLLLTTRREALALYREIWRITSLFDWPDDHGRLWRDVLRQSARQEYEAARFEDDPEIVNRLLVVGRDAVHQVAEKFLAKRQRMAEEAEAAFREGSGPPGPPPIPPFPG